MGIYAKAILEALSRDITYKILRHWIKLLLSGTEPVLLRPREALDILLVLRDVDNWQDDFRNKGSNDNLWIMAMVILGIKDDCFYDYSAKGQPDQTATHPHPTPSASA